MKRKNKTVESNLKKLGTKEIRKATNQDIYDIIDYLQKDIIKKGFEGDSFWHNIGFLISNRYNSGAIHVMVVNSKLVCYGVTKFEYTNAGEIDVLETLEPHRNKGYAKELVAYMEAYLSKQWMNERNGFKTLPTWMKIKVRIIPLSVGFWDKLGYTCIEDEEYAKFLSLIPTRNNSYIQYLKAGKLNYFIYHP